MQSSEFSAILSSVSERNNNEIKNEMKNQTIIAPPAVQHDGFRGIAPLVITHPIDNGRVETSKVLVSCCGCNEEVRITREEANEWTDTDWFMCHECE